LDVHKCAGIYTKIESGKNERRGLYYMERENVYKESRKCVESSVVF
jgi:hypothetical protein